MAACVWECKVCGKDFLTKSRHFELCSDECRKVQAVVAKREFDQRTKGDRLVQLHESAYYYWYNRLRKLKKADDSERAAVFKAAFDTFRKEAVRQKAAVKRGEMKLTDFADWLIGQQNEAGRLMEQMSPKVIWSEQSEVILPFSKKDGFVAFDMINLTHIAAIVGGGMWLRRGGKCACCPEILRA